MLYGILLFGVRNGVMPPPTGVSSKAFICTLRIPITLMT
jgi:hypothetical protein